MLEYIFEHWLWFIVISLVVAIIVLTFLVIKSEYQVKKRVKSQFSRYVPRDKILGMRVEATDSVITLEAIYTEEEKPEWYKLLTEELKRLPVGRILFNPPETMKLGTTERIEARISQDSNTNLVASLKGRGVPKIEEIKVSELMKVRLSGHNFQIISLNEENQIIGPSGFTEWAWNVTPEKSGKQALHLHVTLRIRLPFGEERKDHPVVDRELVVLVNPIYSMKSFVVRYWKWILTALLFPLVGWLWNAYFK